MSTQVKEYGLGRYAQSEVAAFTAFPLRAILQKAESKRPHKYWNAAGWVGDQLNTPHCVAYSWLHWLHDGPITHKGVKPLYNPFLLYKLAQDNDEWIGNNYEGTSVNAGAKVLRAAGLIAEYRWTFSVDELIQSVLEIGPSVIGVNWYYSMFDPAPKTNIIEPKGWIAGGHALKVDGYSQKTGLFRLKNSWGKSWGNKGFAYISDDNLQRLLNEDGECCLALEQKVTERTLLSKLV